MPDVPSPDGSATPDETTLLLRRCGGGDQQAFRRLYELHAARLNGIALRLLHQPSLAADAVHDAFLQVWQRATEFDPARGSGSAWMTGLLRYRAIDILRRRNREEYSAEPPEEVDSALDPFAVLDFRTDVDALHRCLDTLSEGPRRAVSLAFLDGLSHSELSARLHAPLGTVKSWVRRALLDLRRCLDA